MQLTRDVKTLAAAVRPAEHAVRRGGSVKPNCDELDEKTKLSLSRWGGHFCVLLRCQSHDQHRHFDTPDYHEI